GPRMIRASDAATAVSPRPIEKLGRPMTTSIMESANFAVLASQDDDGLTEKLERVVVPRLGNIALMADDLPRLAEDHLLFELEELRVVIDPRRQAAGFLIHSGRFQAELLLNDRTTSRAT